MHEKDPVKPPARKPSRPSWVDSAYLKRMTEAGNETWLDRPVTRWILGIVAALLVLAILTHALDLWNFPGEA
ncbi:hypothetical protein GT347_24215 [Xylophilus rhododendri]|uniref:Uncharacterized protein n=1 Tax=Xylophilus rhododendri TaxID=2697032 RepID=A0A857JA78_9BURK|nr:hypothetical protein [Xylophilus rhododendri]QHJ00817.1 hypothetical protein GT347_24215 [Xylophilus rhododendri]